MKFGSGSLKGRGRPRCRWEDNVKMDLGGKGCGGGHWIEFDQGVVQFQALICTVMNLWVIS
jgi:hypothetical protein